MPSSSPKNLHSGKPNRCLCSRTPQLESNLKSRRTVVTTRRVARASNLESCHNRLTPTLWYSMIAAKNQGFHV